MLSQSALQYFSGQEIFLFGLGSHMSQKEIVRAMVMLVCYDDKYISRHVETKFYLAWVYCYVHDSTFAFSW